MSPHGSAAAWAPARPRPHSRATKGVACLVLGLIGAHYVAGCVFATLLRLDIRSASPLTLWRYAYYYGERPEVHRPIIVSATVGAISGGVVLFVCLMPRRRALHGEARFARRREIRAAGLLGEQGIILGQLGRRCLMLAGQQGVALAAPPRAGKGAGVVIQNALNWSGSLICVDIKRENWRVTAGFRQRSGQTCHLFDPFSEDGRTARWNPFFYVSPNPARRVNDLQRIAEMLYPDPPNVDPFWTAASRSLFLGIALYLFETPDLPKTIGEVLRQGMASDDEGFGHHWKRVIEGRNSGHYPLSSACVFALYDVIDLAPVTASSIRKTFTSRLDLWLNPMLDAATAANDFDLRDLRRKPMSIYVGANPDDLNRLRPVLSLFFQQAIGLQTRELPESNPALKHQVLMLLDEFTALGRIPIIAGSISYLPGYNVRVVLVIQTPAQLRDVYGPNAAETMLKSLAARIVFAPKDIADAREISEELGYTTVQAKSVSRPRLALGSERGRRGASESVSDQRRALLLPQEVKELGADDAIIFYENLRPIRCRKLRYFQDARFRARVFEPPLVPALPPEALVIAPPPRRVSASVAESKTVETSEPRPTMREATLADVDRIDTLKIEDIDVDLSTLQFPDKARLSKEDIGNSVEMFMAALRRRRDHGQTNPTPG